MSERFPTHPQGQATSTAGLVVFVDPRGLWPVLALRGALAIVFGIVAVGWPAITLLALALLFAVYVAVDGIWRLVAAYRHRRNGDADWRHILGDVLIGVLGIAVAIVAVLWPAITVLALAILVGAWLLVGGITEIVMAIRLRAQLRSAWFYVLGGVLSVVAGLVIMLWPRSGAVALAILLGVLALLIGAVQLGLAWRIRSEIGSEVAHRRAA